MGSPLLAAAFPAAPWPPGGIGERGMGRRCRPDFLLEGEVIPGEIPSPRLRWLLPAPLAAAITRAEKQVRGPRGMTVGGGAVEHVERVLPGSEVGYVEAGQGAVFRRAEKSRALGQRLRYRPMRRWRAPPRPLRGDPGTPPRDDGAPDEAVIRFDSQLAAGPDEHVARLCRNVEPAAGPDSRSYRSEGAF